MKITKTELKEMVRKVIKESLSPDESDALAASIDISHRGMKTAAKNMMQMFDEWEENFYSIFKKMEKNNLLTSEHNKELLALIEEMAKLSADTHHANAKAYDLLKKIKIAALAGE